MINKFRGEYRFLSNFYLAPVEYEGIAYQNSEAAYQSAKVEDYNQRLYFKDLNPHDAKKEGRRRKLRSDWDKIKFDVMYRVVTAKFSQNEDLKQKLLATGNKHLEEGNTWGDKIWGTVKGEGQNHLGKILMRVREELK